jgi:hypothetical protein
MKKYVFLFCLIATFIAFPNFAKSKDQQNQAKITEKEAIEKTEKLISEVIEKSYLELKGSKIKVKTFQSDSNYFKSRFSLSRYLKFQKLNYVMYVNPEVFTKNAPENAVRAIIAHELAHVLYYRQKNRFELLGLVSLTDKSFTAKFERKTDLEAIKRGYGEGLIEYRKWLYQNIPAADLRAKKRDYFSPEEIDLMLEILKVKPDIINLWRKNVPRNLSEISKDRQD